MQLSVARLCLDCQEIHEHDRCPVCTSEAFGFITRWVQVDAAKAPAARETAPRTTKADAYRRILNQAPAQRRTSGRWLRKAGIVVATGYLARWGWNIASQLDRSPRTDADRENDPQPSSR
jgi:RNA polymerase subunit RPABC4/transcription elongation factor Spt4